ncbi:MAG: hypothetical protein KIT45_04495 [Fimbriimonadia bacterium]|nr:hypothetical protein [Fimbriimonadia bacterium]
MAELILLAQALLLLAGWMLFLKAQTELKAQAARNSLTGELDEVRRSIDALLHKLVSEAASAEARLQAVARELELSMKTGVLDRNLLPEPELIKEPDQVVSEQVAAAVSETFLPGIEYKHTEETSAEHAPIFALASQGLPAIEIARQTGYAPGEVELILRLQKKQAILGGSN